MTELSRPKGVLRVFPGNETSLNPAERENWPIHDRAIEAIMPRYKPSQAGLDALQGGIDRWNEEKLTLTKLK